MLVPLLLFEKRHPREKKFTKKELTILIVNALVYSLAIFAYAAFDTVLVGLIYSVLLTVITGILWISIRKKYTSYPVITYTTLTYLLGTIAALIVRFH